MPKSPARPVSIQYGQPAQGSPVLAPGTGVDGAVVVVVVDVADVVPVVDVVDVVLVDDVVDVVLVDDVVEVGLVVVVVVTVAQLGRVMVLSSRLTSPFRASTRPATVVPVCTEMGVNAKTLPTKVVPVPRAVSYTHLDVYKRQE